ncbi:MAG: hypothetical protein M3Q08_07755 [Pseudomonadota bacterium]|nr:hypothetical protein [Pseudomonadota bacterium]
MKRALTLAALAATLLPAFVPAEAQRGQTKRTAAAQERVRQVIVYGRDPCPRGRADEIVICARRPAEERYRIPRELRNQTPTRGGTSWAARARSLETVGRTGIQSCSTVGPGGFTGCWEQMMRTAREERRAAARGE